MNSEIRKILNANRARKIFFTHTSMITPKGTFAFPHDELDHFWETYCNTVYKDGDAILGLNEVSQQYMPVIADVDIKVKMSSLSELKFPHISDPSKIGPGQNIYTEEQLRQTVKSYQTALKKTVKDVTDRDLTCVVLEKPSYLKKYTKDDYLSNGFHLHFPYIFLDKSDIQIYILPIVQSCVDKLGLFGNIFAKDEKHKPSKIIDTGIFTNPWLMYGSRKSEDSQPYRVSKIYDHETRIVSPQEALGDYEIFDQNHKRIPLAKEISYYLPRILSIFLYNRKAKSINPTYQVPVFVAQNKNIRKPKKEYEIAELAETVSNIGKLLPLLDASRAEDYNEWMRIGWIIYNATDGAEEGRELWKKFSERSEKYNEIRCDYLWDRMVPGSLTVGTLRYMAKCDNPQKYQKLINSDARNEIKMNLGTGTHYDIAKTLYKLYADEYICVRISKPIWFRFHDHFWEEIESGFDLRNKISEEILEIVRGLRKEEERKKSETDDDIKKEMHNKRIKYIDKLQENLKKAPYKDNIMKEACYKFYRPHFVDRLDANPNLIAFKNGVYDFIHNEFRTGRPEDYFSKTLPINYDEDLSITDKRVEKVLDFFKQIFPNEELRHYFLDRLCEIFEGGNKRKEIYMWVGRGDNGKSVTQKLIEKMLGKYAVKMPTTLITGKKPNVGSAFPEIARLAGVRSATMDEPDASEKINIGTLKVLTGNDTLSGRDLYESGKQMRDVEPLFKLNFICNALPYFETVDKATWNRMRVIEFESRFVDPKKVPETEEEQERLKIFPKDPNFERNIPGMIEPLAWYLIYHRIHFKKEEHYLPPKVKAATKEYKDMNDFVGQFLSENYVPDEESWVCIDEIYPMYRIWYRENMAGSIPTKRKLKEDMIRAWGDPVNPGCRWKGYKQYTLEEQIKDKEIVILPLAGEK